MRTAHVVLGALVVGLGGCHFKPVTREDRVAASVAASRLKPGTRLTSLQLDQMDKDKTIVCDQEMTVGSHIPRKTCRTMRRVGNDEARSEDQIRQFQTSYRPGAEVQGATGSTDTTRPPLVGGP